YAPTLPFGKHQGHRITDVPHGYLKWLLNADAAEPWLRAEVRAELRRRGERFVPAYGVLADLEETLTAAVAAADDPPHEDAGVVADHILDTFEEVRQRHGRGEQTELFVPARRDGLPDRRNTA